MNANGVPGSVKGGSNGGGGSTSAFGIADITSKIEDGSSPTAGNPSPGSPVQEQPDPDNIKMFVGQIPRTLSEAELRNMFQEFGRVHQINVLRDKVTGVSKGKRQQVPILLNIFLECY